MKPAPFRYEAPTSVAECLELLAAHGDEAKILAGGQSLVPLMNLRLAQPAMLVDINGVEELAYAVHDDGGALRLGALTRLRSLERDARLAASQPLLAEAIPLIGHTQIRNRSTVGGNLAHADPAAELPAVLMLSNGALAVTGPDGDRTIAAREFFQTYFTTDLAPDEIIREVQLPSWRPGDGWCVQEVSRRHGDFALVGVACRLSTDADGVITEAGAAFFGVGGTPHLAESAALLVGTRAGAEDLRQLAGETTAELDPDGDVHVSADYRKHVGGVLARRAFAEAYARADGRAA